MTHTIPNHATRTHALYALVACFVAVMGGCVGETRTSAASVALLASLDAPLPSLLPSEWESLQPGCAGDVHDDSSGGLEFAVADGAPGFLVVKRGGAAVCFDSAEAVENALVEKGALAAADLLRERLNEGREGNPLPMPSDELQGRGELRNGVEGNPLPMPSDSLQGTAELRTNVEGNPLPMPSDAPVAPEGNPLPMPSDRAADPRGNPRGTDSRPPRAGAEGNPLPMPSR